MCIRDRVKRGDMMNVDDVTEILAVNLIGAVPDDEQIVISTNRGAPLVGSDSLAGKAYMNICHRIMGEEVAPFQFFFCGSYIIVYLFQIFQEPYGR